MNGCPSESSDSYLMASILLLEVLMDTILKVHGKTMVARYIGFVATCKPGDMLDLGDTLDDVWMSEDGRKFVEVYVNQSWKEYDSEVDGPIWTDDLWDIASIINSETTNASDLAYWAWILQNKAALQDDQPIIDAFGAIEQKPREEPDYFALNMEWD